MTKERKIVKRTLNSDQKPDWMPSVALKFLQLSRLQRWFMCIFHVDFETFSRGPLGFSILHIRNKTVWFLWIWIFPRIDSIFSIYNKAGGLIFLERSILFLVSNPRFWVRKTSSNCFQKTPIVCQEQDETNPLKLLVVEPWAFSWVSMNVWSGSLYHCNLRLKGYS